MSFSDTFIDMNKNEIIYGSREHTRQEQCNYRLVQDTNDPNYDPNWEDPDLRRLARLEARNYGGDW